MSILNSVTSFFQPKPMIQSHARTASQPSPTTAATTSPGGMTITRVVTTGRTATRTIHSKHGKDDYSKHAKNDDDHKDRDHWKNGDKDDHSKHGKDDRSTARMTTITRVATTGRTATRTVIPSTAERTTARTSYSKHAKNDDCSDDGRKDGDWKHGGKDDYSRMARATTRSTMVVGRTPRTTIANRRTIASRRRTIATKDCQPQKDYCAPRPSDDCATAMATAMARQRQWQWRHLS